MTGVVLSAKQSARACVGGLPARFVYRSQFSRAFCRGMCAEYREAAWGCRVVVVMLTWHDGVRYDTLRVSPCVSTMASFFPQPHTAVRRRSDDLLGFLALVGSGAKEGAATGRCTVGAGSAPPDMERHNWHVSNTAITELAKLTCTLTRPGSNPTPDLHGDRLHPAKRWAVPWGHRLPPASSHPPGTGMITTPTALASSSALETNTLSQWFHCNINTLHRSANHPRLPHLSAGTLDASRAPNQEPQQGTSAASAQCPNLPCGGTCYYRTGETHARLHKQSCSAAQLHTLVHDVHILEYTLRTSERVLAFVPLLPPLLDRGRGSPSSGCRDSGRSGRSGSRGSSASAGSCSPRARSARSAGRRRAVRR